MKSPVTGKEMMLTKERRSVTFRKEPFEIVFLCYKCQDSGESFTTKELDELNVRQVHSLYRAKHCLPFPEDIKRIRNKYGLPASRMSEILGMGINTIRNYESGEMPSLSNARLIQMAENPADFIHLVDLCETIPEKTKSGILANARKLIKESENEVKVRHFLELIKWNSQGNVFTGFVKPDLEKITEMVMFFSEKLSPWKTKLNKLLFYADFAMFGKFVNAISGAKYRAINMGPVPENYDTLFDFMKNKGHIDIEYSLFSDGNVGERFRPATGRSFNSSVFSKEELDVLNLVCEQFRSITAKEIVEISHKEQAWIQNHQGKSLIEYTFGFELSGLKPIG
jgi:putative zinc finger/helix-turn-helix YgiT family protein